MKTFTRILFAICAVFLFRGMLACGGGGATGASDNSGTTGALTIAERISVVEAQEDRSPQVSAFTTNIRDLQRAVADLPADADYFTDEQHIWVEERSMEAFDIINEIMCMMSQTAYAEMLNLGPYIAQIDIGQCGSGQDDASVAGESETNQSSGTGMTEYEFWTVDSSRNGTEPHLVKTWIHQEGDEYEPAMTIFVFVEITEAASATNPFGLFTLNFVGQVADEGQGPAASRVADEPVMRGTLRTTLDSSGNVGLEFVDEGTFGDFVYTEAATLFKSPDGLTGSGSVAMSEVDPFGSNEMQGDFAFNENYFLRSKVGDSLCQSRTAFDETTWNYGLYDAVSGERISLNSGFPIQADFDERTQYGWVGYYGLWLPNDRFNEIHSGDTIYRLDYSVDGPPTETPYEVFKSTGKLMKHTRHTMTLGDIVGIPLSLWRCEGETCGEYRIVFDGTQLMITGERNQESYVWVDVPPAPLEAGESDWAWYFWSQALGGSVQVNLHDKFTGELLAINAETPVIFYSESTVTLNDHTPGDFVCYENCIDPNEEGGDYYFDASTWMVPFEETFSSRAMLSVPVDGVTHVTYMFDHRTMQLMYQDSPVIVTDTDASQFGYWTGALIPTDQLDQLGCPGGEPGTVCPWMAWEVLDTYYTYETGPNEWNQYSTVIDPSTGDPVIFDSPLMVQYAHTTGSTYLLEYNGFPNLYGIPGKCFHMETGEDVDCKDSGNDSSIRWIPEFSIADGTQVIDMQDTEYLVKGIDKEQRMTIVDDSLCTDAGLATTQYSLPDISVFVAPAIGDEPLITDPPAVIGGVVQ